MTDDKPMKSAYELAMERLDKKDKEAGVELTPPTDEQKAAIAEIRRVYQAKLAEIEILHQGRVRGMPDPAERQALEEQYQRERTHLSSERDRKIEKARAPLAGS
jgi:demethoxyubiquinone hydroxylase (CLK1/Coq7/Cat5 family)